MDRINYYRIGPKERCIKAVAYTPEGLCLPPSWMDECPLEKELPFKMELHSVVVVEKLIKGGLSNDFMDILSNDLGYTMMSERIKRIIDKHLTGKESLRWLSVVVKGKTLEKEYYIPVFEKYLDTLDKSKTIYIPDTNLIVKAAYDYEKVKQYAIFHDPGDSEWQMSYFISVNDSIKRAIEKEGIPGLEFERI